MALRKIDLSVKWDEVSAHAASQEMSLPRDDAFVRVSIDSWANLGSA